MKTIKLKDEKEVLDRQHHTDLEALRNLEENYQQLINRGSDLDEQIERLKSRQKEIEDSSAEYKNETTSLKKQLRALQEKHRDARLVSGLYSVDCLGSDSFLVTLHYPLNATHCCKFCLKTPLEILLCGCFIF